jgi:lipopolysaccharide biosynthesis glycosyltransferase
VSEVLDIAMGFDSRYAPHAAVVIASIVRSAPGAHFRFIMIHDGVDAARRQQVERLAPGSRFAWTQVADDDLPAFQYGHLNRAILFRLGLEKLAPADANRVVYVDADTVVLNDVRELAAADLGDCAIGAVHDCYVDPADFAKRWSLTSPAPRYFNSGVLVIDLERVRAESLFSKAAAIIAQNESTALPYGDQDALNITMWERWTAIEPMWNVQRFMNPQNIAATGRGPSLIHFVGLEKPWLPNVWHPWAWVYWENLRRTPFADEVAQTYNMNLYQLLRLRLKWWINRPQPSVAR